MPFTIAHAALAPPLRRISGGRLDLTALVAGTLAPDFEYFWHLDTVRTGSHTLRGSVTIALPLALAAAVVWHSLLKQGVLHLLPVQREADVRLAAAPYPLGPPRRAALLVASAWLGAISHIVWDSFTHAGGGGVASLAVLSAEAAGLPLYRLLQYGSGVGGLAVLVWWLLAYRRSAGPRVSVGPLTAVQRAVALGSVVAVALAAGGWRAAMAPAGERWLHDAAVRGVIASISGAVAAILVVSVVLRLTGGTPSVSAATVPLRQPPGP